MTEPIHSSDWTGPIDDATGLQRGAFTHRYGDPAVSTDYQRLLRVRQTAAAIPVEVRGVIRLGALLFFLSPVILLTAWFFLHSAVRDAFLNDNRAGLVTWGVIVMALALTQLIARSVRAILIRKAFLTLLLVSTVAFSVAYVRLGLESHARASASIPERTYELLKGCGRHCSHYVHQRADGSTVEGVWIGAPVPYGTVCARVQRLDGDYGFSWLRVLERSSGSGSEILWPIRRGDCFGNKPVSSLHG